MTSARAQTLIDLIQRNFWSVGVEVGVWRGDTAFALLDAFPGLKLIGVDHWQVQPFVKKDKRTGDAPYCDDHLLAAAKALVVSGVTYYSGRLEIITASSLDAARACAPRSVDFIFLDADHRTQSVIDDYKAWLPALRAGGAMLGHDANWHSVQEALKSIGETFELLPGNVWMINPPETKR